VMSEVIRYDPLEVSEAGITRREGGRTTRFGGELDGFLEPGGFGGHFGGGSDEEEVKTLKFWWGMTSLGGVRWDVE